MVTSGQDRLPLRIPARGTVEHSRGSAIVRHVPDRAGLTWVRQHEQQHDSAEDGVPG